MKVTVQSHFKASQQQPQGTLTAASIWTHLHVHPSLCLIVCFLEEMARVLDGTLARFSKLLCCQPYMCLCCKVAKHYKQAQEIEQIQG